MTTVLVITLDEPAAALHHDEPVAWTAGHVRHVLHEAGLIVHDVAQRPDLVLGVERPPRVEPTKVKPLLVCPIPWCAKQFRQPHHLKLHMRSHQQAPCSQCGTMFALTGLHSHEAKCGAPPAAASEPDELTKRRSRRRTPPPPRAAEPAPPAPPAPAIPDLGPITRRPFDPDRVRAAAGASSWEVFG